METELQKLNMNRTELTGSEAAIDSVVLTLLLLLSEKDGDLLMYK